MKKTLMTFVAVGFGVSVAFAQTTTPQEEAQGNQTEQTEAMPGQDEEGRTRIEMYELPVAVQDAFKNGQYKGYEVLAIYEVTPEAQETQMQGTDGEAVAQQEVMYEIELASNAATEDYNNQQTMEEDGMEGVETERVSAREPEVVLVFDATGQLVKEEQPEEDQY